MLSLTTIYNNVRQLPHTLQCASVGSVQCHDSVLHPSSMYILNRDAETERHSSESSPFPRQCLTHRSRSSVPQMSHRAQHTTHVVAFKGTEQKKTLADWVQHNQHNTVFSFSFYAQQSLTLFNAPHTICKEILKESDAICHSPIVFHYHHFSMSRDEKLTNVLPESQRANQSSDVKGLWMCSGSLSCCKQSAAQMWETLRDC